MQKPGLQQKIRLSCPVKERSNENTPCLLCICADLQTGTSQKELRELQQKSNQPENKDEDLSVSHMVEGRWEGDSPMPAASPGAPSSKGENYVILSTGVYHNNQI